MKKQNNVLKAIDKIISIFLIVFIVISASASLFFTYSKIQNKMVNIFGYSICYVITGSMLPTLEVGDAILIKRVPEEEIKKDDIITYLSTTGVLAGNYITHRVEEINLVENTLVFTTKGDANTANDTEFITYSKIQGVYVRKIFAVKFLISILSKPINFILFIVTPLFGALIIQLVNFIMELRKKNNENKTRE